jgi:hypothetical protein
MTDNTATKILNTIQEVGTEMAEAGVKIGEKILKTVITGEELVADAKPMNEAEMAKAKAEDERKKQEEIEKMKNIPGRNVEGEIKEIISEKKSEEEKEQEEFLEKIRQQREAEEAERAAFTDLPGNTKREAAKTQFAPGKKKTQAPTVQQMSQTSEFKGGKID